MKTREWGRKGLTEIVDLSGSTQWKRGVALWIFAMVFALLPGQSFAEREPPIPCEPTICTWECLTTGAVDDPGKLSKTNIIICVGNAIEKPGFGTATFTPGTKKQKCVNPCATTYGEPVNITYSQTNWFEPELPTNSATCGESSYTAYVKGNDANCSSTEKREVGTFTVKVVAVTGLGPGIPDGQGGLEPGSEPPTYWVCQCADGDIIVTAILCPSLAENELPDCWTFTGGTEIDKLHRKVSKAELKHWPVTFTVTAGTSSMSIVLKGDEERDYYNAHGPADECLFDNFPDPDPVTDKCGNSLRIDCVDGSGWPTYKAGHYEYLYNGTWVGTCYYNGGENNFLYKTTKHNCRILRTWHLTQEPVTPTKWTATKYDCLAGGSPSQNCRTAPTWNSAWGRPADESLDNPGYPANSCENQGTPSSPCPPW